MTDHELLSMHTQLSAKVSVLMITFNHERFIARAIESALSQETDFDFEIIIGEDSSTDGTREIVSEYHRKHPQKIRSLVRDRNLGMHRNFSQALRACSGEYVAILEGDDFWTSPNKLQKQVDFLDSHRDYVICFHNATVFRDGDEGSSWFQCPPDQKKTSTVEDLLVGNFIPTCSVMCRKSVIDDLPDWTLRLKMLDWPLHILSAQQGHIGYLNQTMAAHRMHSGGAYSGLSSVEQQVSCLEMYEALRGRLNLRYEKQIRTKIFRARYALAVAYMEANDLSNARKYSQMCLSERPFSSYLAEKLKLVVRLRTPRLFKLGHELKSLSHSTKARCSSLFSKRKALITEKGRA